MPPSLKSWLKGPGTGIDEKGRGDEFNEPPLPLTENYPFQYTKDFELRGSLVRFRPIRSDDDDLMLDLFSTFSEDTIYHRFFTHITITPSKIKRFTHIDYKKQMAIVALDKSEGKRRLMGVARYAASKERENWAEMAVVVGDKWHGNGVGTALLEYLFDVAESEGYEGLYGLVHYDNRAIVRVFEKLSRPTKKRDNGTELQFEVFLTQEDVTIA